MENESNIVLSQKYDSNTCTLCYVERLHETKEGLLHPSAISPLTVSIQLCMFSFQIPDQT
jgi:hypothetical protein